MHHHQCHLYNQSQQCHPYNDWKRASLTLDSNSSIIQTTYGRNICCTIKHISVKLQSNKSVTPTIKQKCHPCSYKQQCHSYNQTTVSPLPSNKQRHPVFQTQQCQYYNLYTQIYSSVTPRNTAACHPGYNQNTAMSPILSHPSSDPSTNKIIQWASTQWVIP